MFVFVCVYVRSSIVASQPIHIQQSAFDYLSFLSNTNLADER